MKTRLIALLELLTHGLRQADLEFLDKITLAALAAQFRHWAVACDEAAKRPTRRAKAASPATSSPREPAHDTDTIFTLAMRSIT
ncbi:MAG: hypothetical protein IPG83_02980 [Novosphingobium sp.]|nr:hypothetical protein [Novosphingobium sp.]